MQVLSFTFQNLKLSIKPYMHEIELNAALESGRSCSTFIIMQRPTP
jgi:hypothetical protein